MMPNDNHLVRASPISSSDHPACSLALCSVHAQLPRRWGTPRRTGSGRLLRDGQALGVEVRNPIRSRASPPSLPPHDPGPLSASVLVCSLSNTPALADCDRSNAVSVLDLREPFDSPIMCMMHGQAYLAGTEIGRQLAADEHVKIVCSRRTHASHQ
jgi:hypothetical protein